MKHLNKRLIITLALVWHLPAFTQDTAPILTISEMAISPSITWYRSNSRAGNTSSVVVHSNDQAFLIDPNFYKSTDALKEKFSTAGIESIDYISTTHGHLDHSEQWSDFYAKQGFLTLEQQRDHIANEVMKNDFPITIIDKDYDLVVGDVNVSIMRLPNKSGHTDGDLIFYFKKEKALYVGDYLFVDRLPVIDSASGSLDGYIKNIEFIITNFPKDTRVIAGHTTFSPKEMKMLTMTDYSMWKNDIVAARDYVREQLELGVSRETLKDKELPQTLAYLLDEPRFVSMQRWLDTAAKK